MPANNAIHRPSGSLLRLDQPAHRAGADPLVAAADLVAPLDQDHAELAAASGSVSCRISSR